MNNKLNIQDIIILDEGIQIKRLIESKYGSLREFYEKEKPEYLSLKAIRNYCSYEKVTSYTFKVMLVELFEMGWDEIVHTPVKQLSKYIFDIFHNIILYDDESDLAVFNYLLDLCIKNGMKNETAIMYRNIAKNHYYRDDYMQTFEFYNKAIDMLDNSFFNTLIILHVELAEHLHMERNVIESEKHFTIAENYTKYSDIEVYSKYTYFYRRGLLFNSIGQYSKAREYFSTALEYANTNTEVISETGATLLAIGTSYKRENKYEEAKDYYFKSLFYFKEEDMRGHGAALNNIADIFYKFGDYESAIRYIEKAMAMLNKEGITYSLLASAQTYAEIKIVTGDESACYSFFEILKKTSNTLINRNGIRHNIYCMIEILNSSTLLTELEKAILYLINNTKNEAYINELYSCIGRLSIKRKHEEE